MIGRGGDFWRFRARQQRRRRQDSRGSDRRQQYREMLRLEARQNEAVNGYFICDRGRYGFGYANHPERPRRAYLSGREVPWDEATLAAAFELARISREHGPNAVACVGGTRSSLETQGALKLFCRTQGWRDPQFFWDPLLERKVFLAVLLRRPDEEARNEERQREREHAEDDLGREIH